MPRTDGRRAALLLWGSWLLVTGLVFDFMSGIFHPYYTVALAPAIGALVGIGAVSLWKAHHLFAARAVLASGIGAAAIWGYLLLQRTSSWHPWLRFFVLMIGLAVAGYVLVMPRLLAGHHGGGGDAGPLRRAGRTVRVLRRDGRRRARAGRSPPPDRPVRASASAGAAARAAPIPRWGARRQVPQQAGGFGGFGGRGEWGGGGAGGLLDASTPSAALKAALFGQRQELHLGRGDRRLEQRGGPAARDRVRP